MGVISLSKNENTNLAVRESWKYDGAIYYILINSGICINICKDEFI